MSKPSIIYMGTPDFAVAPLKAIVEAGYDIKAVVTVADKPSGRGQKLNQSAVKKYAVTQGLNVLQPIKLKSQEFLEKLQNLKADLFIVIAFRMLPKEVWQLPPLGTFNIHGSLLPNYRGAAPINWAIINGEKETGVTSFFINEEIDAGSMIDSLKVEISETETAGTLHNKLMQSASELVLKTIKKIEQHKAYPQKQTLTGKEKPAPKIFKNDCKINWQQNPIDIYNFIRGLSPYPVAWTDLFENKKLLGQLRIFKARIQNSKHVPLGELNISKDGMCIGLNDSVMEILELQWPGKKKMDAKSFVNGFRTTNKLSVYQEKA